MRRWGRQSHVLVVALSASLAVACVGRQGANATSETSEATSQEPETTESESSAASTESSTESETESSTESETETETESDSDSDDPGIPNGTPCDSDASCASGICHAGFCRECVWSDQCGWKFPDADLCDTIQCTDWECTIGPRDCSMGDSCSVGYCDLDWEMGDSHLPLCQFEYCDMYDGIPELELKMTAVNFTPPPQLDIGSEVMVYGYGRCDTLFIVRDLLGDELLVLDNRGLDIGSEFSDQQMQTQFGRTMNELTGPLLIDLEDYGACGITQDNCGEYSRGAADVALGLDDPSPARVLDATLGWASGGYMVNNRRLEFGDWDCIFNAIYNNRTFIARDACSGDACPAPTFEAGCVEPAVEYDRLQVIWSLGQASPDNYLAYNFQCTVVDTGEGVDNQFDLPTTSRFLDCAAVFVSPEDGSCED